MTASVWMHSQARIGGTQILVKHAMIQVYVYFKILLTCIFLLFILWYTMLKVSLHTEDCYLVITNDNLSFAYNFFAFITFSPSLSDAELQQLQNQDHEKHQHAKNVDTQERATKKGQCSFTTVPVDKQ